MAALLTTVVACICIFIQAGIDAPAKKEDGLYYPSPTASSFFLAFGSILFAFGGASSFPTIQNDMIDKTQFERSVNFAFVGKFQVDPRVYLFLPQVSSFLGIFLLKVYC